MFQIIFAPRDEHAVRIRSLNPEKMELLHFVLYDITTQHFSPQARNYRSSFNHANGLVTIVAVGVTPFSDKDHHIFTQMIANQLSTSQLNKLYRIHQTSVRVEPLDMMLSPGLMKRYQYPQSLMSVFDLIDRTIPHEFLCPITGSIMHDPAYLTSNSKINYECTELTKWIIEKNTDPTTRQGISAPGIINNAELQKRIFSFVMDMVLGKPVEHYFESEKKDAATQCSLSSNTAALFGDAKLNNELYALSAKALRRLVNENNIVGVEKLLTEYGADNIINLQDENPSSCKTALHIAIERNNLDVAKLLIARGAKSDIENAVKETAESLARKSDNEAIRNLFLVAAALTL